MIELLASKRNRVGLEDSCKVAHLLRECSVAGRLPVRERAAAKHAALRLLDDRPDLAGEASLADPRRPENGDEFDAARLGRLLPNGAQPGEFALSADHRHSRSAAFVECERLESAPREDRLLALFHLRRSNLLVANRRPRRSVRCLPDEDRALRGGRLQPLGRVDGASHHGRTGVGPDRTEENLARVDADAECEASEITRVLVRAALHLERSSHGSLWIVLMGDRGAEDRHERVADHLVNGTAVALDDLAQLRHAGIDQRAQVLRVGRLREVGEARDVRENDRGQASLLAGEWPGGGCERSPAVAAEALPGGVLPAAGGTAYEVGQASSHCLVCSPE